MTQMQITPDIDMESWTEMAAPGLVKGDITRVGLLRNGTVEGRAAFEMLIRLPDGNLCWVETTWRLMRAACAALNAGPVGSEET